MDDVVELPLSSVAEFQEGPGILAKDFHDHGVPLVRLAGLGGYEVSLEGCNYVLESLASSKWSHFRLRKGDILISTSASFGRPAVVREEAEGAIFYTGIIRFRSKSPRLDDGYLKVFLGSDAFMRQAEALASGSVIRHFGPSHLRAMTIPLPDPLQQRQIAHVATELEQKIEINRRSNRTLETLAQTMFRDWFVNFGPTRAKIDSREAYLEPQLWSLFPAQFDNDGIPEGWHRGSLHEIASSPPRNVSPQEVAPSTPYIALEHMPRRSAALAEWTRAEKATTTKSKFKTGEFLFGKLRPYFHKVGVAPVDGICSTDIVVMTPRQQHWSAMVFACISSDDFVEHSNISSTGTKMPRTSWPIMRSYELALPPPQVAEAFESLCGPMIERIIANVHESRTLAALSSLLLRKLMSGEIRVASSDRDTAS